MTVMINTGTTEYINVNTVDIVSKKRTSLISASTIPHNIRKENQDSHNKYNILNKINNKINKIFLTFCLLDSFNYKTSLTYLLNT